MNAEAEVLLVAGVVGLVAGWLANVVTKDEALLVYIISAIIGAFAGGYLSRVIGPVPIEKPLIIEVMSATFGAIILTFVINRTLRD